jgi:hypothetical protein
MIRKKVRDTNQYHFLILPHRSGSRGYDLWVHLAQGWIGYAYNIRRKREAETLVRSLRDDLICLYELEQLLGPEAGKFGLDLRPIPPGIGDFYYSEFVKSGGIIKHVQQRGRRNCALTSIAMLTDVPYEVIETLAVCESGYKPGNGLDAATSVALLKLLTNHLWQIVRFDPPQPLPEWTPPASTAVMVIHATLGEKVSHAVVVDGRCNMVYDGLFRSPWSLSGYLDVYRSKVVLLTIQKTGRAIGAKDGIVP